MRWRYAKITLTLQYKFLLESFYFSAFDFNCALYNFFFAQHALFILLLIRKFLLFLHSHVIRHFQAPLFVFFLG